MRTIAFAVVLFAGSLCAQKLDLNFDRLGAKAKEKSEISLDGSVLTKMVEATGQKKSVQEAEALLGSVTGVYIRNYEFEKRGEYSDSDLDPLRKQVGAGSGWSKVVSAKDGDESTEIYMLTVDGKPTGLLVIAAEPKELSVVHIMGEVEMSKWQELVKSTIQFDLKNLPQAGADGKDAGAKK